MSMTASDLAQKHLGRRIRVDTEDLQFEGTLRNVEYNGWQQGHTLVTLNVEITNVRQTTILRSNVPVEILPELAVGHVSIVGASLGV